MKNGFKKEAIFPIVILTLFLMSIAIIYRDEPERWLDPEDLKGQKICIDKRKPLMIGYAFNDSINVGNFYRDYHDRIKGDTSYELRYNVNVNDCLIYTNNPLDSVYHIDGVTNDTTLYLNLYPKDEEITWSDLFNLL
ncbi:hypothetical protein [Lewinella sp. 4G2]|uniref:hypothetical protein n=1 Tax=Lewinella sp. 4G2 TaxID=1803372 RepID=UPI0007B472A7|nr:hypothetical protein [Lewinella sp. 4G2]OAV43816.1 hypothetical protein A3850_004575 [Lewinella sp. 4G2]